MKAALRLCPALSHPALIPIHTLTTTPAAAAPPTPLQSPVLAPVAAWPLPRGMCAGTAPVVRHVLAVSCLFLCVYLFSAVLCVVHVYCVCKLYVFACVCTC